MFFYQLWLHFEPIVCVPCAEKQVMGRMSEDLNDDGSLEGSVLKKKLGTHQEMIITNQKWRF